MLFYIRILTGKVLIKTQSVEFKVWDARVRMGVKTLISCHDEDLDESFE